MTKLPKAILTSGLALFSSISTVFAQTATPTATVSATTKGGLPAAGNETMTAVIVTISALLVIIDAVKFFQSFR